MPVADVYAIDRATGVRETNPIVRGYPVNEALGTTWTSLFAEARKLRAIKTYDLDLRVTY